MFEEDDSLEELSRAASRKVPPKPGASARRVPGRKGPPPRRSGPGWGTVLGTLIVLAAAGGLGYLVYTLILEQRKPKEQAVVAVKAVEPTASAAQAAQRTALLEEWENYRRRDLSPGYKELLIQGRDLVEQIDRQWQAKKFDEAAGLFPQLRKVMDAVPALDQAKAASERAREEAAKMLQEAGEFKAEKWLPRLLEQSAALTAEAQKQYDEGKFQEAAESWHRAMEAYGRVGVLSQKAQEAHKAARTFEGRVTRRFEMETVAQFGGPNLEQAWKLAGEALRHYAAYEFEKSIELFRQADNFVPQIEASIERQIGSHYYAMRAGYLGADLLMKVAAGQAPAPASWDRLRKVYEALGISSGELDGMSQDPKARYIELGRALLDKAGSAVQAERGEPHRASFDLGVQVRIVQRLLATDADTFAAREGPEIRRAVQEMLTLAPQAGWDASFTDSLNDVVKKLAIKPEFEALNKSRAVWTDLVRKLEDFDKAMKIVPRGGEGK